MKLDLLDMLRKAASKAGQRDTSHNSNSEQVFIASMKNMGGHYVKSSPTHNFFDVLIGSDLDDDTRLSDMKKISEKMTGKGLRVRKVTRLPAG